MTPRATDWIPRGVLVGPPLTDRSTLLQMQSSGPPGWSGGKGVGLQGQQPYPIKTRTLQKLNSLIRLLTWLDDDDDDRYHHHRHHDHHLRVGQVHLGFFFF